MPISGPQLYYTMISSLPALSHYEQAERLPITAERLRHRFRMLPPNDAELLDRVLRLISWSDQPFKRSDPETVALYRELAAEPRLHDTVEFRANLRTAVAALRRRQLGQPAPAHPDELGPGSHARHFIRHWEQPDFGLGSALPWIPELRAELDAGNTYALECKLLSVVWSFLDARPERGGGFHFEAIVVYLFKWDVIERWLTYCKAGAQERLAEHVDQLREGYRQLTRHN